MSKQDTSPKRVMAALFIGFSRHEQMVLLGRPESTGVGLYRAWADQEPNVKAREALLKAATREEENSGLSHRMTTTKAGCERWSKPLPVRSGAQVCLFQSSFWRG